MKRRTILAAFGSFCIASTLNVPSTSAADLAPVEIVQQYLAAWNANDGAKAASYFDERVNDALGFYKQLGLI